MKYFFRGLVSGVALVLVPAVAGAVTGAAQKPIRHLTYSFTYTQTGDRTQHDSGIGGPVSGMAVARSGAADKGQITADVMQVAGDGGLVVSVSEKANESRSADPVTCAVYGNTNVLCDPTKKVNEEELALLRLLGKNFVDAAQIDEKNHWRVQSTGPAIDKTADFTVESNDNNVVKITESRVDKQKGAQAYTSSVDGKITYDLNKTVPMTILEDTMLRQNMGMGDYNTDQTQVSLTLLSDSLGGK